MSTLVSRPTFSWRALALLSGLVLACFVAIHSQRPPAPLAADAPPQAFAALRARAHLDWIAAEPHPIGSLAHTKVREGLMEAFRKAGLEVQTQQAQVPVPQSTGLAWVENVMARLKGSGASDAGAVMLACHYDSVEGSFGAADDGAGMASLLEVLRALQAGPALKRDVIFLVTDGEEIGLLGAQAFVRHHPWARDVKQVVNLEARGTGGPTHMFETTAANAALVESLAASGARVSATSLAGDIYRLMPNATDMTVFRRAGMKGLGFAFIDRPWDYHHPTDHPAHLDLGSLQQMGEAALGLARSWGNGEPAPRRGDAVYFNPLGHHFIHYSAAFVPWLSLAGLLLAALVLVRGFRSGAVAWRPCLRACGALLLALLGASVLAAAAAGVTSLLHRAWGVREGFSYAYNPWYPLLAVATAGLTVGLLARFVRRPETRAALHPVALLGWALLAAVVSLALPGGSYLFQLPLLLTLLGVLAFPNHLKALVPAALIASLLMAPMVATLGTGLGFGAGLAGGLGFLTLLCLLLLWPLVEALHLGRVLLPAGGIAVLLALLAGGTWARATFHHRAFANVRYVQNLDTQRAWWVMEKAHESPWTRRFLDRPVPGNPSWEGDGRIRPTSERTYLHQDAPRLGVPEPKLILRSETNQDGLRVLRLSLESDGAAEVWIRGEDLRFCRGLVEGHLLRNRTITRSGDAIRLAEQVGDGDWRLHLYALPRMPIVVELTFLPGKEPIRIGLQARYGGLPAELGDKAKPLPGIQPIHEGNCTWVGRVLTVQ